MHLDRSQNLNTMFTGAQPSTDTKCGGHGQTTGERERKGEAEAKGEGKKDGEEREGEGVKGGRGRDQPEWGVIWASRIRVW